MNMTGERKRNELWRERPDLLEEMLNLRFNEGWSLRKLSAKYDMDHVGIGKRCKEYMNANPGLTVPKMPIVGKLKIEALAQPVKFRRPNGITLRDGDIRITPRNPKRYEGHVDEFGERVNPGRSYKSYLQEQYPHLTLKKIRERDKPEKE